MELKEYIRKYQGKYYITSDNHRTVWMKIVKVKEEHDKKEFNYSIICNCVSYYKHNRLISLYSDIKKLRILVPPEEYGYQRICKSLYDAAKRITKGRYEYVDI